jgi:hypothetical protein
MSTHPTFAHLWEVMLPDAALVDLTVVMAAETEPKAILSTGLAAMKNANVLMTIWFLLSTMQNSHACISMLILWRAAQKNPRVAVLAKSALLKPHARSFGAFARVLCKHVVMIPFGSLLFYLLFPCSSSSEMYTWMRDHNTAPWDVPDLYEPANAASRFLLGNLAHCWAATCVPSDLPAPSEPNPIIPGSDGLTCADAATDRLACMIFPSAISTCPMCIVASDGSVTEESTPCFLRLCGDLFRECYYADASCAKALRWVFSLEDFEPTVQYVTSGPLVDTYFAYYPQAASLSASAVTTLEQLWLCVTSECETLDEGTICLIERCWYEKAACEAHPTCALALAFAIENDGDPMSAPVFDTALATDATEAQLLIESIVFCLGQQCEPCGKMREDCRWSLEECNQFPSCAAGFEFFLENHLDLSGWEEDWPIRELLMQNVASNFSQELLVDWAIEGQQKFESVLWCVYYACRDKYDGSSGGGGEEPNTTCVDFEGWADSEGRECYDCCVWFFIFSFMNQNRRNEPWSLLQRHKLRTNRFHRSATRRSFGSSRLLCLQHSHNQFLRAYTFL